MPVVCLDENRFAFPPVDAADEDGLLMIGGRPTPQRVIEAYTKGIFPWYEDDDLPLWFSPDPRFVLFPEKLHTSRSMKKLLAQNKFSFAIDTAFEDVIAACAYTKRSGQSGTWITPQMAAVYTKLHQQGFAHSAEAWQNGKLVGGMYGIRLGRVFFGESMFSREANASKFAFLRFVQHLHADGVALMDCQVYTPHVESLGAELIPRSDYLQLLKDYI